MHNTTSKHCVAAAGVLAIYFREALGVHEELVHVTVEVERVTALPFDLQPSGWSGINGERCQALPSTRTQGHCAVSRSDPGNVFVARLAIATQCGSGIEARVTGQLTA